MKKLILLLALHLSLYAMALNSISVDFNRNDLSIEVTEHKPMLVEGRTWWYTQDHYCYGSTGLKSENGISVGEEVEINGQTWHKINVISTENSKWDAASYDNTPRTITYMREEDGEIYTAYFDGTDEVYKSESIHFHLGFGRFSEKPLLTYQYSNIGDSFKVSDDDYDGIVTIDNISSLTNSGYDYTLYEGKLDNRFDILIAEGLGRVNEGFFFDPYCEYFTLSYENQYNFPQLRYVTDPDGTIIYEGIGGYKLWEQSGVDNVVVEDDSCRWYNLQGFEIAEPTIPGIYIRSSRNGNEKVFIR